MQYRWFDYALIAFGVLLLTGALFTRYALGLGDFWVPAWVVPA